MYSPSTIAASSIAASLTGLKWHLRSGTTIKQLLNSFTDLTGVNQVFSIFIKYFIFDIILT